MKSVNCKIHLPERIDEVLEPVCGYTTEVCNAWPVRV